MQYESLEFRTLAHSPITVKLLVILFIRNFIVNIDIAQKMLVIQTGHTLEGRDSSQYQ